MEKFIQIKVSDYTIKIGLENINYDNIPILLHDLEEGIYNWYNFYTHDSFWYCDGSKFLTCHAVNHDAKLVILG